MRLSSLLLFILLAPAFLLYLLAVSLLGSDAFDGDDGFGGVECVRSK